MAEEVRSKKRLSENLHGSGQAPGKAAMIVGPASAQAMPRTDLLAAGLNFPTSAAFADDGELYVAESGLPFGGAPPNGRVLRIGRDGSSEIVLEELRAPVNGLTWGDGGFYISEGGFPGRISGWSPDGSRETLIDGLPSRGNYHTNMVAKGRDGWLYFSQGAMTNSGVVGLDGYDLAWLKQVPHPCDLPGFDIVLTEEVFTTADPFSAGQQARTAAFSPFGASDAASGALPGRVPCTAAILRCRPDGSDLSLVAWGLRNAYGIGFLPDGRLIATEQSADARGSRPIGNAPDALYVVRQGAWYGWPDFVSGRPVTDQAFKPQLGPQPLFILANHDLLPPPERPVLEFAVNAAPTKFAVLPSTTRWPGQIVVCLFGDEKPVTAPPGQKVGRRLVRVDPRDWSQHALLAGPFARPIDVVPSPDGNLIVVDFGTFELLGKGQVEAAPASGKLWKVSFD
jgi:glucose/arabinose dehydrogenase